MENYNEKKTIHLSLARREFYICTQQSFYFVLNISLVGLFWWMILLCLLQFWMSLAIITCRFDRRQNQNEKCVEKKTTTFLKETNVQKNNKKLEYLCVFAIWCRIFEFNKTSVLISRSSLCKFIYVNDRCKRFVWHIDTKSKYQIEV